MWRTSFLKNLSRESHRRIEPCPVPTIQTTCGISGYAVDLPRHSHDCGIKIARLWPPAFRLVTGHIRKGTIFLTSRARLGVLFTNILLNKIATTIALPPELFFHDSLLFENITALSECYHDQHKRAQTERVTFSS